MNTDTLKAALDFAAKAHLGQKIPGSELPYLSHVVAVYLEVNEAWRHGGGGFDLDLAAQCALLHDTIEDTPVTYEDVLETFGKAVADGVLALSKDPEAGDRNAQMADSLQRILQQPAEVAIVKLSDRIDNLRNPPHYWTKEKRQAYQAEGELILKTLSGKNTYLEARLRGKIEAYGEYI